MAIKDGTFNCVRTINPPHKLKINSFAAYVVLTSPEAKGLFLHL